MSIKPKLSSLVKKQLPEFIREDYQTFAAFIQAYYQYLEQNNQSDISKYRDIDQTLESFVEYFRKELAGNLPNVLSDKRLILQKIKDQYLTKGTEASYRLLFRLLFDKEISIDYPSRQLLRASDGRWQQDYSIFVQINRGNPEEILGKVVQVITPVKNVDVRVDNFRYATVTTNGIGQISDTIVELFIDKKYFGNIQQDYIVQYGTAFEGVILPTTTSIEIVTPGQDFSVGDLHYIKSASGEGSLIKVTRITTNGGILNAQFIKFGLNYGSDFTTVISPTDTIGTDLPIEISSQPSGSGTLYTINVSDRITTLIETGLVNEFTYAADLGTWWQKSTYYAVNDYVFYTDKLYRVTIAGTSGTTPPTHSSGSTTNGSATLLYVRTYGAAWDGGYSGKLLREFYVDNSTYLATTANLSQIKVNLGAVAKYPGYYSDNLGFLDDAIYIQDGNYYQAYSYVIKIDERLDSYKNAVKSMLHPAGMALFGEYELKNDFDVSVQLESLLKFSRYAYSDEVKISDSKSLLVTKPVADSITLSEVVSKAFSKSASDDTVTVSDSTPTKIIGKLIDDFTSTSDSSNLLVTKSIQDTNVVNDFFTFVYNKSVSETLGATDSVSLATSFVRDFSETLTVTDQVSLVLQLAALLDSLVISDSTSISFNKVPQDSVLVAEVPTFNVGKGVSDQTTMSDDISLRTSFVRNFLDSVNVFDAEPTINWFVNLQDEIVLSEEMAFSLNKLISDVVQSAETIGSLFTSLGLEDSASTLDALSQQLNKSINESISFEDLLLITTLLQEYITISDDISLASSREFLESQPVSDLVSYLLSKQETEGLTASDTLNLNISKPSITDSSTTTDSGFVQLNPYVVSGYIAVPDYVGTSSTF